MTALTDPARTEAIATYHERLAELAEQARTDDRTQRPIAAARKRQAARAIRKAVLDEQVDALPTGLGGFG